MHARRSEGRRIGAELKFPLVRADGSVAAQETVTALWRFLCERGWEPIEDGMTRRVVGARRAGPQNDSIASCETGYCKIEFSLAHVGDLFELDAAIGELRALLRPFGQAHGVRFLGYGIQPVTPPSRDLLFKKERSCFWDKAVPSNRRIARERGDDVHLFTINAATHVHVGVSEAEAVRAVNVLGGFAGPQIALTAHSNFWQGELDRRHKSVAETMWDWWEPARGRSGVPPRPFESLEDYVGQIAALRPIYVKRDGVPVLVTHYPSFHDYYHDAAAVGKDLTGKYVSLIPSRQDIDLHNSCYWYTARISRYFTVENRVHDQQPPDQLVCVAALTLGLLSALDEGWEELAGYGWDDLRRARDAACREGLAAPPDGLSLPGLACRMLEIARRGLHRRGLGEEPFLDPLKDRLARARCPADEVAAMVRQGGVETLVARRAL